MTWPEIRRRAVLAAAYRTARDPEMPEDVRRAARAEWRAARVPLDPAAVRAYLHRLEPAALRTLYDAARLTHEHQEHARASPPANPS